MEPLGPSEYGDRIADIYDELYGEMFDTEGAVELLAGLAGTGPALELGIGTGRLAMPLVERGVEVHGIDASEAMVARLRAKEGGDRIPVTMGDFASVPVEGRFRLVFVAFNTLFGLLTQDDQLRCFAGVAEHLSDDGAFVVEAFVPDLARFDRGQRTDTERVEAGRAMLQSSTHDPVNQRVDSLHIAVSADGIKLFPVQIRYAWPSELDLMARLAGLRLRDRWADWRRSEFTEASAGHISVYQRG